MWRPFVVFLLWVIYCDGKGQPPCTKLANKEAWIKVPLSLSKHHLNFTNILGLEDKVQCEITRSALEGILLDDAGQPQLNGTFASCNIYFTPNHGVMGDAGIINLNVQDLECNNTVLLDALVHIDVFDDSPGLEDPCIHQEDCSTVAGVPVPIYIQGKNLTTMHGIYVRDFPLNGTLFRFVEGCMIEKVTGGDTTRQRVRLFSDHERKNLVTQLHIDIHKPSPPAYIFPSMPARIISHEASPQMTPEPHIAHSPSLPPSSSPTPATPSPLKPSPMPPVNESRLSPYPGNETHLIANETLKPKSRTMVPLDTPIAFTLRVLKVLVSIGAPLTMVPHFLLADGNIISDMVASRFTFTIKCKTCATALLVPPNITNTGNLIFQPHGPGTLPQEITATLFVQGISDWEGKFRILVQEGCIAISPDDPLISFQLPTYVIYQPAALEPVAGHWDQFTIALWDEDVHGRQPQVVDVFIIPSKPPVAQGANITATYEEGQLLNITLHGQLESPLDGELQFFVIQDASNAGMLFPNANATTAIPYDPHPLPGPQLWVKPSPALGKGGTIAIPFYARDSVGSRSHVSVVNIQLQSAAASPPECIAEGEFPTFQLEVKESVMMNLSMYYDSKGDPVKVLRMPTAPESEIGTLMLHHGDPSQVKFVADKAGKQLLMFEVRNTVTEAVCHFGIYVNVTQPYVGWRDLCFVNSPGAKMTIDVRNAVADSDARHDLKGFKVGDVAWGRITDWGGKDISGSERQPKSEKEWAMQFIAPRALSKAVETIEFQYTLLGEGVSHVVNVTGYIAAATDIHADIFAANWVGELLRIPFPWETRSDDPLQLELQPYDGEILQILVDKGDALQVLDPAQSHRLDPTVTWVKPMVNVKELAIPFKFVLDDPENCLVYARKGSRTAGTKASKLTLSRHSPGIQVFVSSGSPDSTGCNQQFSVGAGSILEVTVQAKPLLYNASGYLPSLPPKKFMFNLTSSGSWLLGEAPLPSYLESAEGTWNVTFQAEPTSIHGVLDITASDEDGSAVECKVLISIIGGKAEDLPSGGGNGLMLAVGICGIILAVIVYSQRDAISARLAGGHGGGYQPAAASEPVAAIEEMEMGLAQPDPVMTPDSPPKPPSSRKAGKSTDPSLEPLICSTATAQPQGKGKVPVKQDSEEDEEEELHDDEEDGWDQWSDEDGWKNSPQAPAPRPKPLPTKVGKAD